jgi:hypothetical protein
MHAPEQATPRFTDATFSSTVILSSLIDSFSLALFRGVSGWQERGQLDYPVSSV